MNQIVDEAIRLGNDAEYIQNSEAFRLVMSELERSEEHTSELQSH